MAIRLYIPIAANARGIRNRVPGIGNIAEKEAALGVQHLSRTTYRLFDNGSFLREFVASNNSPKNNTYQLFRDQIFYPAVIASSENGQMKIRSWIPKTFGQWSWGLNGGRENPIETGTPAVFTYDYHKTGKFLPNLQLGIHTDAEIDRLDQNRQPFYATIFAPTRGGTWCREKHGLSTGEDTDTQQFILWSMRGSRQYAWGLPGGEAQQESGAMKGAKQCGNRYNHTNFYVFRQVVDNFIYYRIREYNPVDFQVRNPIKTSFKELAEVISSRTWPYWVFAETIRNVYPALFLLPPALLLEGGMILGGAALLTSGIFQGGNPWRRAANVLGGSLLLGAGAAFASGMVPGVSPLWSAGLLKGYPVDSYFFMATVTALIASQSLSWGLANSIKGIDPFLAFVKAPAANWIAFPEIMRGNAVDMRGQDPSPGDFAISRETVSNSFEKSNFRIMDAFMILQIAGLTSFTLGLLATGHASPAAVINAFWAAYQLHTLAFGKNNVHQSNQYIHAYDIPRERADAIIYEASQSMSINDLQDMLSSVCRQYSHDSHEATAGRIMIGSESVSVANLVSSLNVTYENSLGYNIALAGRNTEDVVNFIGHQISGLLNTHFYLYRSMTDYDYIEREDELYRNHVFQSGMPDHCRQYYMREADRLQRLNFLEENIRNFIRLNHNQRDIMTRPWLSLHTGGVLADIIPYFDKHSSNGNFTALKVADERQLHRQLSPIYAELGRRLHPFLSYEIGQIANSASSPETKIRQLREIASIAQRTGLRNVFSQADQAFEQIIQNRNTVVLI